jgi:hypothetical protein
MPINEKALGLDDDELLRQKNPGESPGCKS